jgi:hypothetical protein
MNENESALQESTTIYNYMIVFTLQLKGMFFKIDDACFNS